MSFHAIGFNDSANFTIAQRFVKIQFIHVAPAIVLNINIVKFGCTAIWRIAQLSD